MVCLLLLGVLVMATSGGAENATVEGSITVEAESTGFKMIAELCGNMGRLDVNETFIFLMYITDGAIKEQCSNASLHQPAWECMNSIVTGFNNNSADYFQFPFGVQIFSVLGVLCNDSRIKSECVAEYYQQQDEPETCITSRMKDIDAQTTKGHLRECLYIHAISQCSTDVVRKCDAYTGSVVEEQFKQFIPPDCDPSIIFG